MKNDGRIVSEGIFLIIRAAVLVIIGYILFFHVFFLMRIEGTDMAPSLKDGDMAIAYRRSSTYEQGDVCVYRMNDSRYTGRIVGLASDVVVIDGQGRLTVNGIAYNEETAYSEGEGSGHYVLVPEEYVYVLCDSGTGGKDSRSFGPVPIDQLEGRIITILRRRGI